MQELNQAEDIKQLTEKVKEQNVYFSLLKKEINRAIIGQEYMVDRLLIGLLGNGQNFRSFYQKKAQIFHFRFRD